MRSQISVLFLVLAFCAGAYASDCADRAKAVMPQLSAEARQELEAKLAGARSELARNPENAEAHIWAGRRTAYLGNYKEAIAIFTGALERFPKDARLYRHRGHRYITLRCFDDAIRDLEAAAKLIKGKPDETEPDGLPNARNMPTSTLQSNIWYHFGLAYYLKGQFHKALAAYDEGQKVSLNNDMRVATGYWHYMTLRRLDRRKAADRLLAGFSGNIEVIENGDYLKLIRLNRGEARPENLLSEIRGDAATLQHASLGYGIGNYFLYNGDLEKAMAIFRRIVAGDQWASFGYIAAEAEIRRLKL
jgi:tetratricopeptide (TPR) repeat protein